MLDRQSTGEEIIKTADEAAAKIIRAFGGLFDTAVILGSGLELKGVKYLHVLSFGDVFPFAQPIVSGHPGKISLASIKGKKFIVMAGRYHYYEGYSNNAVILPVLALAKAGVKSVILTNAAGALNPNYKQGQIMLVKDHINLTGSNPLIGLKDAGDLFVDLSDCYDPGLRNICKQVASESGISLEQGVYIAVSGPSYETPAEVEFLRTIGGDAVGMSTVYETIGARFMEMQVAAVSVITNETISKEPVSHSTVLANAKMAGDQFSELIIGLINHISKGETNGSSR